MPLTALVVAPLHLKNSWSKWLQEPRGVFARTFWVETRRDAEDRLQGDSIDFVVADFDWLGEEALPMLRSLRGEGRVTFIPVMVIESQRDPAWLQTLLEEGVNCVIGTPPSPRILRKELGELTGFRA